MAKELILASDRCFEGDPKRKEIAAYLYSQIRNLPLICPHGHVDPRVLADPDYSFGTPSDLFIVPDHYLFRMLYSQGISLESLGVKPCENINKNAIATEIDSRRIWQIFADNYYLFRGTPSRLWLDQELHEIFGVREKLNSLTAQSIYEQIAEKLATAAFRPRTLFDQFNIEVLATTDAATDTLEHHKTIRASGWQGKIIPTFRPDSVINLDTPDWCNNIDKLSEVSGIEATNYGAFIRALEQRRDYFKQMGATATDHAARTPYTAALDPIDANIIYQRALKGDLSPADTERFTAHMLMEMARMSCDDGLVMQLHVGSLRNHNDSIFEYFGADKGADIPLQTEFTRNLRPLLNKFGNDRRYALLLFTLDETTYGRELAPLAGHYPAVKLGPPWWFFDSVNGMSHYFDLVMETAGIYNTAGFNDDTRAFCSIPARHDVWRRACANWLAGMITRGLVDIDDAEAMMIELAYGLAKRAYRL